MRTAQSLFRWVGGKARLTHILKTCIPPINTGNSYFEPFLGAANLFLTIKPKRAYLGDQNQALINCLTKVQANPKLVWRYLQPLSSKTGSADYYEARKQFNENRDSYSKAALFIYLNRTCFNGIWRVNEKGEFNVPYGNIDNPIFPTLDTLRAISDTLKSAKLRSCDFEITTNRARAGDFVYLDPPYPPINGTAFFTHYTKERFGEEEQVRTANVFSQLSERGCNVLLSNADTPLIRSLYNGYYITEILTQRTVASHGKRYKVIDLVVSNYKLPFCAIELLRSRQHRFMQYHKSPGKAL